MLFLKVSVIGDFRVCSRHFLSWNRSIIFLCNLILSRSYVPGRYYLEFHSVSLYMVKQPRAGMPAVYFWGVMAKEESSSDVVIEGSWVYWNHMGTFRLVAGAFP